MSTDKTIRIKPFRLLFDSDLKKSGLTQTEVAAKLNVRQQSISAWRRKNEVPQARWQTLVDFFDSELGEKSELCAAYNSSDWLNTMGVSALERAAMVDKSSVAWDRREEYTTAVTAQAVHNTNQSVTVIDSINQIKQRLNKTAFDTADSAMTQKADENLNISLTHEAHNKFLRDIDSAFPNVVKRQALELGGIVHQFDLVINKEIYICSAGRFKAELLPHRELEKYSYFLVRIAAMARVAEELGKSMSVIVCIGTAGYTTQEISVFKEMAKGGRQLNLIMPLISDYNNYFEFVAHLNNHINPQPPKTGNNTDN